MPYINGVWQDEDSSVSGRVAAITAQDSDLMKQARTAGLQSANRRGLGNSSMGIGAGIAATLAAATPIASQEAQQANQNNLAAAEDRRARDLASIEDKKARDIAKDNVAASDRNAYTQQLIQAGNVYSTGIANTLQNDKIPADTRTKVQADMAAQFKAQQQALAKVYGVNLNWS